MTGDRERQTDRPTDQLRPLPVALSPRRKGIFSVITESPSITAAVGTQHF